MPPTRTLDDRIDRLYQLPLDEFTAARNALAKEVAAEGGRGDDIRKLVKPPAAAWAINQVHWSRRPVFDAFVAASAALRSAHADVLAGKRADLRAAGTAHEEALESMLKAALAILANANQPATDATRQAIISTLRALPGADERPGRLTTLLQPRGFELLAGMPTATPRSSAPSPSTRPAAKPAPAASAGRASKTDERARAAERAKAIASAKEALAEATRVEKAASQTMRREEFEAARSVRDLERANAQLTDARAALDSAQQAVDEAEQEVREATRTRDAIARRVREASDTLARARVKTEAAQAELARADKR
jgi:hypothetical protein